MHAMTLADPPQTRHISTSILKTRFSRCAQVIAMDGMYAGFAGAKTGHGHRTLNGYLLPLAIRCFGLVAFSPFCWRHQRSVLAVRRKHTVKTCQIDSGQGHKRCQFGDEIHRLNDDVGGPIPIRRLQLIMIQCQITVLGIYTYYTYAGPPTTRSLSASRRQTTCPWSTRNGPGN